MLHLAQCVHCGEFTQLVAPVVYAGVWPCAACNELGIFIPVTAATPRHDEPFEIEDFEILVGRTIYKGNTQVNRVQ